MQEKESSRCKQIMLHGSHLSLLSRNSVESSPIRPACLCVERCEGCAYAWTSDAAEALSLHPLPHSGGKPAPLPAEDARSRQGFCRAAPRTTGVSTREKGHGQGAKTQKFSDSAFCVSRTGGAAAQRTPSIPPSHPVDNQLCPTAAALGNS